MHPGRTWFTHAAHMLPIALSSENARSPAGASTHSGRASARARNAVPAQTGVALEAGRAHGWARIRRISTDDGLSGIARAGGLRLAWPRASARRLARDSGFIAHSPSARSLRVRAGTPAHPGRTWFTHAAHMLPIALSGENARSPAGASTHSGRASARTRNAAPAQAGVALEAGRVHGSARIRRISADVDEFCLE